MSAQPPETKAESPDIDLRPICVKCKVHFCDNSEICNDCDDTRVKSEDYGPDDEIIGIKAEPLSSDDEAAIAVAIMESIEMPEPDDNPTAKQAAPAEKGSKPEDDPQAASEATPQVPTKVSKTRGKAKSPAGSSKKRQPKKSACDDCRKSKKRCVHRNGEGNKTPQPSTSTRKQTAGPKKKPGPSSKQTKKDNDNTNGGDDDVEDSSRTGIKIRIKNVQADPTETSPTCPAEPEPAPQKRKRGRPRKISPVNAGGPAAPATEEQEEEGEAVPRKRARRVIMTGDDNQASLRDAPVSVALALPSLFEDPLHGASKLAPHVVLSQNLHMKLEDCEDKWQAAMDALWDAKQMLDSWVRQWERGRPDEI